jgi:hypothetical protein
VTILPYLTIIGLITMAMLLVWVACVWLPELVRREHPSALEGTESIDDSATTGRFRRLDVED